MNKKTLEKYFKNTCSPEERDAIEYWLTDKRNKEEVEMMIESLWGDFEYTKGQETAPSFDKIVATLNLSHPRNSKSFYLFRNNWIYAVAACLLVVFGIAFYFYQQNSVLLADDPDFVTISTEKGERKRFLLWDGSEVYLNGESKLRYSTRKEQQPIYLEGEAYFNLAKGKEPIIIRSEGLETKVRASVFNISAFPKDSTVTLAVNKGNAEIRKETKFMPLIPLRFPGGQMMASAKRDTVSAVKKSDERLNGFFKLTPAIVTDSNTYVVFNKQQNQVDVLALKNNKDVFGWKNGILYFQNASYEEIASKLERWYGVNISFCATKVRLPAYNAEFTNQELTEVLYRICNTLNLTYKIEGKNVYLCNRTT